MIRARWFAAALLSLWGCGDDFGDFPPDFPPGTGGGIGPGQPCDPAGSSCVDCNGDPVAGWCDNGTYVCPLEDECIPDGGGTPGPAALWARVTGGTGFEVGRAIAIGPDGSIVVVGTFTQQTNLGGDDFVSTTPDDINDTDLFVAKYSASGAHIFSRAFGASGDQRAEGVAVDAGNNIVVVGRYTNTIDFGDGPLPITGSSDLFVARFDARGGLDWATSFNGGANGTWAQAEVATNGDVVLAGATCGVIDLGTGETTGGSEADIFVSRLDSSGNAVFARRFGGGLEESANDVALGPSGDIFVAGTFRETIDFGSGPILSEGAFDGFWTRFDGAGNAIEAHVLGGPGGETPTGIAVSSSGDVALIGTYQEAEQTGISGGYLAGYSPDGTHRFTRLFSGASAQAERGEVFSVAFDPEGRIVIAGQFMSSLAIGRQSLYADGEYDIFLAALDLDGFPIAARRIGNFYSDFAWGLAIDEATSDILLSGEVHGGMTLGLTHYNGKGNGDLYVARFKPETLSAP